MLYFIVYRLAADNTTVFEGFDTFEAARLRIDNLQSNGIGDIVRFISGKLMPIPPAPTNE